MTSTAPDERSAHSMECAVTNSVEAHQKDMAESLHLGNKSAEFRVKESLMPIELYAPNSQTVAERVEQTVLARTGGRIRGLRVQLSGDRLVITGRTSTYYSKQLATHAAIDAAETAFGVQNEVEVC